MEIIIKILQFILSISILVILHEMGHFLFARLFKTRVERFYLFFDPWFSLFKIKRGETEYGIGWLPLGGYVKISGMIDESMDKEQMKQPPKPWEFRSKPSWQRLLIMLGGVLVNFILALVIYAGVLWIWGDEYLPTKNATYGIMTDSLARDMGLRNGDHILAVDGKTIEDFHKIVPTIILDQAKSITVQRDSQTFELPVPSTLVPALLKEPGFIEARVPFIIAGFAKKLSPAKDAGLQKQDKFIKINGNPISFFDQFKDSLALHKNQKVTVTVLRADKEMEFSLLVPGTGLIGVAPDYQLSKFFKTKKTEYGFIQAIPAGITRGFHAIRDYLKQFPLIFSSHTKGYESIGGFGAIASIFPGVWDWESFWNLTAFLSIILAVMNILPIPALDGGHVFFILYEIITRRKPGEKFMEYAQITGMVILFALLIFANGNDLFKFIRKLLAH